MIITTCFHVELKKNTREENFSWIYLLPFDSLLFSLITGPPNWPRSRRLLRTYTVENMTASKSNSKNLTFCARSHVVIWVIPCYAVTCCGNLRFIWVGMMIEIKKITYCFLYFFLVFYGIFSMHIRSEKNIQITG